MEEMQVQQPELLPLEKAEILMFQRFYEKFAVGEYDECKKIIDLMERLSIV